MRPGWNLSLAAVTALLVACGGMGGAGDGTDNADNSSGPTGEQVYRMPLEDGNTFTCATCHALDDADDEFTRPGHPIGNAVNRPSYKNGQLDSLRDAVNSCVTEWMTAEPLAADDERWVALRDWLEAQAGDGEAAALSFQITEPPADVTGGDPQAGREVFNTSCAVCHGVDGGGTNKALSIAGRELDATYVAERIRLSGEEESGVYDGLTGGRMPFWAPDRMSDDEMLDVVAFVVDSEPADPNVDPTNNSTNANPNNANSNPNNTPAMRQCDATHAKVGQTMEFSTAFHDVAGTAEILDDCTIEIRNFTYDGSGIDVRIYAAEGGNYDGGFAISEDLRDPVGYDAETLTLQLPEDRTLDEVDGLSVWCVDVGVSFGDGLFE